MAASASAAATGICQRKWRKRHHGVNGGMQPSASGINNQ